MCTQSLKFDSFYWAEIYGRPCIKWNRFIVVFCRHTFHLIRSCCFYITVFHFQALIIALTSDFIPRIVFRLVYSEDYTMNGFVNSTLACKYIVAKIEYLYHFNNWNHWWIFSSYFKKIFYKSRQYYESKLLHNTEVSWFSMAHSIRFFLITSKIKLVDYFSPQSTLEFPRELWY